MAYDRETQTTADADGSEPCPGCGLVLPISDGPTHAYFGSSASCWALFGELLAREFNNPEYFAAHQLTVDTYAVQHPGVPERRTTQSVGLHLMTLCLVFEQGADPGDGPRLHKRMVNRPNFHWLEPPRLSGRMTVADVLPAGDAQEHSALVRVWARDVWDAWGVHHQVVRGWIDKSLV
ncbi:MAG: DUF5946 family protein [Actinomycetota bacterium]|nr:DUF5946 family protein [Actinomycetota bacterium]